MEAQSKARCTQLNVLAEKGAARLTQISLKLFRRLRAHWFPPLALRRPF